MSTAAYFALPENNKFNGKNFPSFQLLIETASAGRGLHSYMNRTVTRPSDSYTAHNATITTYSATATLPSTSTQTPTGRSTQSMAQSTSTSTSIRGDIEPMTPWSSTHPYLEEWIQCDAYVRTSILMNVINPNGLGLTTNDTAADMWKSLVSRYRTMSVIGAINHTGKSRK